MSPEQARGLPVDERTDIWSFGVVLYEMLAQRLPFSGATRMDTLVAILDREPSPLSPTGDGQRSAALRYLVLKCLRKNADERYQSANELLGKLKSVDKSSLSQNLFIPTDTAEKSERTDAGFSWLNVTQVLLWFCFWCWPV